MLRELRDYHGTSGVVYSAGFSNKPITISATAGYPTYANAVYTHSGGVSYASPKAGVRNFNAANIRK